MSVIRHMNYNTFCPNCKNEKALYQKVDGNEKTTLCIHCGVISVKINRINWKADRSRAIIDNRNFRAESPFGTIPAGAKVIE